jgi:uncharacterized membrane protein YjjB (DUF3815 family)
MWDMFKSTVQSFLAGRLFANPRSALRLLAAGIALTAVLLVLGQKFGLPLPAAAAFAAFLGGALQPRLFKNLKYR